MALSRNCCALVYALENDLDDALNNTLETVLNCDLNSDPITVLNMDSIQYLIGRLCYKGQ